MNTLLNRWNQYWFLPAPYLDLSVVRIIVVLGQLALLQFYFIYEFERFAMFANLDDDLFLPIPILRILTLPLGWDYRPTLDMLMLVYYGTIAVGFLALIGFLTNAAMALFTIGNMLIISHFYSYGDFHHTEAPLIILMMILVLSPCGKVLTLDSWLKKKRNKTALKQDYLSAESNMAGWGIKLAQWVFALIYLSAFFEKLYFIGGLDWLNGYTLQYYVARDTLARGSLLGEVSQRQHLILYMSQFVAVIFQGTFWISLLIPKLKWAYVPLGFFFHISVFVQLNAFFPEWMLAYAIFVPWSALYLKLARKKSNVHSGSEQAT